MTEPRQDIPTDPHVSRLYREHAQAEPSDAIDQRILARARQAVTARPPVMRRSGWWTRWRMPLTLLTTVMLTLTLTLLVERQPGDLSSDLSSLPSADKPRAESVQAGVAAPSKKQAEAASPARPVPAPAAPSVKESRPLPRADSRERDAARASKFDAEQVPAAPAAADKAESVAPAANAASQAASRSELRAAPDLSTARPAAAPLAKSRADGTRTPELWLEEIRALRSAGRSEEAELQLREFRRAHPDYPLPEEFRR